MESKTEQKQAADGNERLSWHELNTYTTAKLALRQINDALSQEDSAAHTLKAAGSGKKTELLRKAGDFIIEAVDAIATNKTGDYSKLMDRATEIDIKLVNAGLVGEETDERDYAILETANYVGLLGMRLSEDMLDLDQEELPNSFIKFKAIDYTIGQFEKAAKMDKAWDRRISSQEFMDGFGQAVKLATDPKNQNLIKDNFAKARYAGEINFRNGAAKVTSSALAHINAGLADEKDAAKIGFYERSAKLLMSMYDALVSDDGLYASRKLFEDEKEAFKSGAGPNTKNMHLEMDSLLGKFETYEKLVDEATSLVDSISRNELTTNGENDTRPVDTYLLANTDKITNLGKEMFGAVTVLFENTFSPAAKSYSRLDGEKVGKCMEAEKRVAEKLAGLSALYNAWGAVLQHNDGKRINAAEFEKYQSMVKQYVEKGERGA